MNAVKLKTGASQDKFTNGLYWAAGLSIGFMMGMTIILSPGPKQILIPIVGILAVALASIHIHFGLAFLVFITYTRFSDTLVHYHGAPSIAQPWIACLIAIAVTRFIFYGERPLAWKKPMLLMLGFLLACILSLVAARDLEVAQEGMSTLLKDLFLAMSVIILMRSRKAFIYTIWALILAGAFLGTIAVYQYLTNTFNSDFGGFGQAAKMHLAGAVNTFRISGPIGDPNFFGQVMLVLLPIALDRMLHDQRLSLRGLAGWSLVVCILTVFFTFSRGALIAVFGMIALVVKQRRPSPLAIVALVLIVVVSTPFMPDRYVDRLIAIPAALSNSQSSPSEASLRGRLSELLSGVMMFIDHPLLGVGINNYPTNYQDYAQKAGFESRHTERHAHNMYLEWTAETGILGGAVFCAILWFAFKSLRAGRKVLTNNRELNLAGMVAAYELGVVGYLIAALFLHTAYPRYYWLLISIAFGVSNFTGGLPFRSSRLAKSSESHEVP